MTHQAVAKSVVKSFHRWGSKDDKYKKTYRKVDKNAFVILEEGISEMSNLKPATFNLWWVKNHMRYIKKINQDSIRLIQELAYHFLTALYYGKIDTDKKTKNGKTKDKSTTANEVHRF